MWMYIVLGWVFILAPAVAVAIGKSVKKADDPNNLARENGSLG